MSRLLVSLLVFLGSWMVLLISGRTGLFRDPGTFWHILTGARVFQVGFPRTDWLTFSFAGQPWIAHQWLGECLMAALHGLGGFDALLVVASGAVALLLTWLFHRLVAAGLAPRWALLAVALCFVASSHHFHLRPQLISVVLFAVLYARLVDFELGRVRLSGLLPLLALFLLWVNTHGAVVGGLFTFALAIGGWTATWLLGRASPVASAREVVVLVSLWLGCALTVLISPYGLDMPRAWGAILQSPQLPNLIVEHASLVRTRSFQVLLLAVVYLAALVAHGRRLPSVTALLPLVWLLLTFQRVRQAPFFAIAATLALAQLLPAGRWAGRLIEPGSRAVARFPRLPLALLAGALALVTGLHQLAPGGSPPHRSPPHLVRFDPATWPESLIPPLRQAAGQLPPGAAILNDMHLGGLIEYHVPRLRVMIDDRWELFGDPFMLAYFRGEPAWFEGLARQHDARLALAQPGSELAHYLGQGGGWREIARAPAGLLFRRDPP